MRTNNKTTPHFPAAATAAIATIPTAGADRRLRLRSIFASYSAAPTGGRLLVECDPDDGGANITIFDLDITAAGVVPVHLPTDGLQAPKPGALIVTLFSGAGAVVGKLAATTSVE